LPKICSDRKQDLALLRKWINRFNHSGVDGIIAKKRPGRTEIIRPEQKNELTELIDQPQLADQTFWTAKAFHGYISDVYQVECSYRTVVRFFHKQGFAFLDIIDNPKSTQKTTAIGTLF
jgi:transposase